MPYGGILSGLVQGYGQAVIGNEKRQYEEKQKQKERDLAFYQSMIDPSNPEQSAWAWQKYDEVAHGTGGKASSKPSLLGGIGKLIFGHGQQQQPGQQPQQGAPGGQQATAAPQAPAQPINPQAYTPSPAGPVSTTPVVRPQLTPPLPPRQQAQAGQQAGLPDFAAWQASADARKQQQADASKRSTLGIEDEFNQKKEQREQAAKIELAKISQQLNTDAQKQAVQTKLGMFKQAMGRDATPEEALQITRSSIGLPPTEQQSFGTQKVQIKTPDGKTITGFRDSKTGNYFDSSSKPIDMSKGYEVVEKQTTTNSAEVKDLRRLEELKRKPNLTPEENDEKTALEYRKKQLDDASRRADTKLTISLQSATAPPGSREWANQIAQKIVDHEMAPGQIGEIAKGFGKRTQEVSQMISEGVNRLDPHFNYQEADANFKLSNSVGFQQTVRYMDSVKNSIPLVIQRAQELGNSNIRFVNGLANMGKAQLNDPKLAKFQTDALLVADEIAKILQGGGTGSGTSDAKLKQAAEIIRDSDSPKAIAAKLGEVQQLIRYRYDSLTKSTYIGSDSSQNNGGGFSPLPQKPGGNTSTPARPRAVSADGKSTVEWDGKAWVPVQ